MIVNFSAEVDVFKADPNDAVIADIEDIAKNMLQQDSSNSLGDGSVIAKNWMIVPKSVYQKLINT